MSDTLLFSIASTLIAIFTHSESTIMSIISKYGYEAVFGLMLMEGSSLPVPSEVVLPIAGLLAEKGFLNFYLAVIAGILGSIGGLIIDYYIGYFLGKQVVYKHLGFFRIKKESLEKFDDWFARNGTAAVFVSRLIPVVRTWMSFPAGFARMEPKRFFGWSILGTTIWDIVLVAFGFYFLSSTSAIAVLFAIAVFAIVVYLIYHFSMRKIKIKK